MIQKLPLSFYDASLNLDNCRIANHTRNHISSIDPYSLLVHHLYTIAAYCASVCNMTTVLLGLVRSDLLNQVRPRPMLRSEQEIETHRKRPTQDFEKL